MTDKGKSFFSLVDPENKHGMKEMNYTHYQVNHSGSIDYEMAVLRHFKNTSNPEKCKTTNEVECLVS